MGAGARDAADEALMVGAVAIVGLGHTLQAQDLIDRAQADEDFRALLLAADIVETTELGYLFRRLAGRTIAGVQLVNTGKRNEHGAIWIFLPADDLTMHRQG